MKKIWIIISVVAIVLVGVLFFFNKPIRTAATNFEEMFI
jgi:uncharacterized protein YxeA